MDQASGAEYRQREQAIREANLLFWIVPDDTATGRWKQVTQAAVPLTSDAAAACLIYYNGTCSSRQERFCRKETTKHTHTRTETPEVCRSCVHTDCNGTLTVTEENAKP